MMASKRARGRATGGIQVRKNVEVRRRSRRLAPGVIGLSLVMISFAFFTVVVPAPVLASGPVSQSPDCIPCPGGGGLCYPNCGPPPPPPPPPPNELITFYSADWGAGVCVSVSCSSCNSPVTYGNHFYIERGVPVTISPCNLGGGLVFSQWLSDSGLLGSSTSSSTTFTPQTSGYLWLVVRSSGSNNYAGYVLDYQGMTVNSVSATITVPTSVTWLQCTEPEGGACPNLNIPGYGTVYNAEVTSLWVGLFGGGDIWQAGIDVIAGTNLLATTHYSLVAAWYQDYPNGKTYLYNSINIGLGQSVNVYVSQASSTSAYYYFYDYSNSGTTQGYVSFNAPTSNAEWIMETPTYSDPISSGYTIMPLRTSAVFASPTASLSCSSYCPPLGNSYESAVYEDLMSQTYSCGWFCTITENAAPSLLVSPYTSFSV
jgi:Peptidase A4 family